MGTPKYGNAEDKPTNTGHHHPCHESDDRIGRNMNAKQAGGIGTQTKEGSVAQRHNAGVAQNQIERNGIQRHNRHLIN